MTRKFVSFPIADLQQIKLQMLNWGNRFNICCFLDNHNYNLSHSSVECLIAAGAIDQIREDAGDAFRKLSSFYAQHRDWLFGHFAYDLKNETEALTSANSDRIRFPDLFFFVPRYVIKLNNAFISVGSYDEDHTEVFTQISALKISPAVPLSSRAHIHNRFTMADYVLTVNKLKHHILRGDCYEINLCQEFYAENITIDPLQLYLALSNASPNPFSAFYRLDDLYVACLSPERYLKKEGMRLWSQPIKGTSQRDVNNPQLDAMNVERLRSSEKERAENIMVVDLVRNDLSRICEHGTVRVDELCEIYTFPQVHQMISTISGRLKENVGWTEAIRATFPMGSMTGAPKKKVMELIERYELTKRGLFSGSIGYIDPDENFDFNVVIRSVLYNATARYLSFHTGSAITFSSDPEMEYEECLLKASAIKKALAETNTFH